MISTGVGIGLGSELGDNAVGWMRWMRWMRIERREGEGGEGVGIQNK